MTSVTRTTWRATGALLLTGATALGFVSPAANAHALARHEVYPVPPGGVYTVSGRGFGHGHGMSQWGAYGAVKAAHRSTNQVLHFYYPHTSLATMSTRRTIRVLLSAAGAPARGYLEVEPAAGLTVTAGQDPPAALPTQTDSGRPITAWRLQRIGDAIALRDQANQRWHTQQQSVGTSAVFTDTAHVIQVVQPGHHIAGYHGEMAVSLQAGALEAVNVVDLEKYLRGVVPAEMPSSWPLQALQVQAVASRTYAWFGLKHPKASWFDVDGDTRDQAYGGIAAETANTTRAIQNTAGEVVVDKNRHPIFAQYASADGGWTAAGSQPYLPAKADPYDGAVPNDAHAWTASISASSLQTAYPSIGTLQNLTITQRDGNGVWGGRVLALTLVGTSGTVDLSGTEFEAAFGLRSVWFRPLPVPGVPRALSGHANGRSIAVTWKPPRSVKGAARVTGYRVGVAPDRLRRTLPATARQASFGKLARGTHTVRIAALSAAGRSQAASVVVKTGHK